MTVDHSMRCTLKKNLESMMWPLRNLIIKHLLKTYYVPGLLWLWNLCCERRLQKYKVKSYSLNGSKVSEKGHFQKCYVNNLGYYQETGDVWVIYYHVRRNPKQWCCELDCVPTDSYVEIPIPSTSEYDCIWSVKIP